MTDQPIPVVSFFTGFPAAWSLMGHQAEGQGAVFQEGEEEAAWKWLEEHASEMPHVINPTRAFLENRPAQRSIRAIFDRVPPPEIFPLLREVEVEVPSLAFGVIFQKRGIQANVVPPRILHSASKESAKDAIRERLSISSGWLLWVDNRIISPNHRRGVIQAVQRLLQEHRNMHVVWVTSKKLPAFPRFHVISPAQADEEEGWRGADFFLLISDPMQSMVLTQFLLMEAGVVPISSEVGDHDEWVKHLFSGILISRKWVAREIAHYMNLIAKNPYLLSRFQRNGRMLVKKWVEEHE